MGEFYCFKGDVGNILDTKIVFDVRPITITFYKNYKRSKNKIINSIEKNIELYFEDLYNERLMYNTFTFDKDNEEITDIKTICECFLNALDSLLINNNTIIIRQINIVNIIKTIVYYINHYTDYDLYNFYLPKDTEWIYI